MHRFDLDNVQFVRQMKEAGAFASISLGVKQPDYDTVDQLAAEGLVPEYVTIDIAHGHADTREEHDRAPEGRSCPTPS